MKRIAIIGSRKYPRLDLVIGFVNTLPPDTIVVSGGAVGVDQTAAAAAEAHGLDVDERLPNIPKGSPRHVAVKLLMARNTQIIERCDEVVAFWDEASNGTRDSLRKAMAAGKPITVFGKTGEPLKDFALD
jgi:hypothetical protein